jgi:hypothetical protein
MAIMADVSMIISVARDHHRACSHDRWCGMAP